MDGRAPCFLSTADSFEESNRHGSHGTHLMFPFHVFPWRDPPSHRPQRKSVVAANRPCPSSEGHPPRVAIAQSVAQPRLRIRLIDQQTAAVVWLPWRCRGVYPPCELSREAC